MSLKKVVKALKQLSDHEFILGSGDSGSEHSCNDNYDRSRKRVEQNKRGGGQRFFCCEDTFSAKDLNIEVDDVGKLTFPLDENCIEKMIKISSKAKFGSGEETILDTSIRDTQKIPADKLNVTINEKALSCVLERIGSGLNIDKNCTIEAYIHDLLIYGPGQFFKKHRDSEKLPNMIATLVIVLPSRHKGGDLIIEHNKQVHVFFGSQNFDFVKCIAFYSDCQHKIEKVTEGYRVALTFNVVIKSSFIIGTVTVTKSLANAVSNYFVGPKNPKRLIFLLNHSYSEHSLNWNMLKGIDRTYAHALFTVAKKQERIPFLALADCHENRESETHLYADSESDEVYYSSTKFYYWIDELNLTMDSSRIATNFGSHKVCDSEICYTINTPLLFKAYKTKERGWTGNAGATCDYWYRRACVVIFASKWVLLDSFTVALNELYQLTDREGNESHLKNEIDKAGDNFQQPIFWKESYNAEKLLKIVIYLKSPEKAVLILSHLAQQILTDEMIEVLVQLELQYDVETWAKILKNWGTNYISCSIDFIKKYAGLSKNKVVLEFLLKEIIEKFVNKRYNDYDSGSLFAKYASNTAHTNEFPVNESHKNELYNLLKICVDVGYDVGEKKLVEHLKLNYPTVTQSEIFIRLLDNLNCRYFIRLKEVRDTIMSNIEDKLLKLKKNDGWSLLLQVNCRCANCLKVNAFFKSATETKILVPATKPIRGHIYSHLNTFRSKPIKFETLRKGSPFKIVIQKMPGMIQYKEKQLESLSMYLKKLKEVIFVEPEDIMKTEYCDNFENIPPNVQMEACEDHDVHANFQVNAENNFKGKNIKTETQTNSDVAGREVPSKRQKIT